MCLLFADSLTLWKPEGVDWKFNSNLDQLELLFQLKDDLQRFTPVIESQYCLVLILGPCQSRAVIRLL